MRKRENSVEFEENFVGSNTTVICHRIMQKGMRNILNEEKNNYKQRALSFQMAAEYIVTCTLGESENQIGAPEPTNVKDTDSLKIYITTLSNWLLGNENPVAFNRYKDHLDEAENNKMHVGTAGINYQQRQFDQALKRYKKIIKKNAKRIANVECLLSREAMYRVRHGLFDTENENLSNKFHDQFLKTTDTESGFELQETILEPYQLLKEKREDSFISDDVTKVLNGPNSILIAFKKEYLSILDSEIKQPAWFKGLSKDEKGYITRIVFEAKEAEREFKARLQNKPEEFRFDQLTESDLKVQREADYLWGLVFTPHLATKRNTIGISNASSTTLNYKDKTFTTHRIGVPTPIGADVSRAELVRMATINLKQYFYANAQAFIDNYNAKFPNAKSRRSLIPISFISLLTPNIFDFISGIKSIGHDDNTEMLEIYGEAVNLLRVEVEGNSYRILGHDNEPQVYSFKVMHSNHPVNSFTILSRPTQLKKREASVLGIINFALDSCLESIPKNNEIIEHILGSQGSDLLNKAITRYIQAWNHGESFNDKKNHAAWIAALEAIITEEMGGAAILNCMSSKDRTGIDLNMVHAMLLTYEEKNKLPQYESEGDDINTAYDGFYAKLESSGHQAKQGSRNGIGAKGKKNLTYLFDFSNDNAAIQTIKILSCVVLSPILATIYDTFSQLDKHTSYTHWKQNIPATVGLMLVGVILNLVQEVVLSVIPYNSYVAYKKQNVGALLSLARVIPFVGKILIFLFKRSVTTPSNYIQANKEDFVENKSKAKTNKVKPALDNQTLIKSFTRVSPIQGDKQGRHLSHSTDKSESSQNSSSVLNCQAADITSDRYLSLDSASHNSYSDSYSDSDSDSENPNLQSGSPNSLFAVHQGVGANEIIPVTPVITVRG
jgi:tetratricopeptide (TPR) repeat protein